jgi:hypothetical protein
LQDRKVFGNGPWKAKRLPEDCEPFYGCQAFYNDCQQVQENGIPAADIIDINRCSFSGTLTRQVSYFDIELLIGDGTDYGWYDKIYNQAI